MEDDSTKGLNNVIKGPWRTTKTITKAKTEKMAIDMLFVEDMAESVMIPMIQSFAENGLDIKTKVLIAEDISRKEENITKGTIEEILIYLKDIQSNHPAVIIFGPLL